MDFDWSPQEQAFREEIWEFLKTELTDQVKGSIFIDTPARVEFVTKMAKKGWLGMGFPEKYGGSPAPIPLAQFILTQELDRAGAPIIGKNVGTIGATLFNVASEEMKLEWLPTMSKTDRITVFWWGDVRNSSGTTRSFHTASPTNRTSVAVAGRRSGSTMCQKVPSTPRPSTAAASSISSGTERKKLAKKKTASGRFIAV